MENIIKNVISQVLEIKLENINDTFGADHCKSWDSISIYL